MSSAPLNTIVEYKDFINVTGTFNSSWKDRNVPGKYEVSMSINLNVIFTKFMIF